MSISFYRNLLLNTKNIYGFKTKRKIIVFSVDDYGNVRVDSKEAKEKMNQAGLKVWSRFDAFDTLETKEDIEMLYESLSSVKDKNGNYAVFTPFSVPCNIDFEKMEAENYRQYHYELLPQTYEKLAAKDSVAYDGAWRLWQEGIKNGLMAPQFHGREHINLKVFNEKLAVKDYEVLTALKNRSYTSISNTGYNTIGYTAAFDFYDFNENKLFDEIIKTGLECFEQVFGYKSVHFNAPGASASAYINQSLFQNGVRFIDNPLVKREHKGSGKYKIKINYTGKILDPGLLNITRNVVFEPCADNSTDWVSYTLKQIEIAFKWHKPAVISSHRVNFCGHINTKNRKKGINSLKELLQKIVNRWPDVEFMASKELGNLLSSEYKT